MLKFGFKLMQTGSAGRAGDQTLASRFPYARPNLFFFFFFEQNHSEVLVLPHPIIKAVTRLENNLTVPETERFAASSRTLRVIDIPGKKSTTTLSCTTRLHECSIQFKEDAVRAINATTNPASVKKIRSKVRAKGAYPLTKPTKDRSDTTMPITKAASISMNVPPKKTATANGGLFFDKKKKIIINNKKNRKKSQKYTRFFQFYLITRAANTRKGLKPVFFSAITF